MRALRATRWAPWAGLVAAPAAWVLHQELLDDLLHFDCRLGGPWIGIAATVLLGAALVAGGAISWRTRRRDASARDLVALLGVMAAAMFGFAIALQMLATLIVPRCAP